LIADLYPELRIEKAPAIVGTVNLAVAIQAGKARADTSVLNPVHRRYAVTLAAKTIARPRQQEVIDTAVWIVAEGASFALGRKRTHRLVLESVRTGLLRVASLTGGVGSVADPGFIVTGKTVTTETRNSLIYQRVIRFPAELVDYGHVAVAAESGGLVNQLTVMAAVNSVAVGA
jgi:hypothetical protein